MNGVWTGINTPYLVPTSRMVVDYSGVSTHFSCNQSCALPLALDVVGLVPDMLLRLFSVACRLIGVSRMHGCTCCEAMFVWLPCA
jgi:hypothetical protein